MEASVLEMPFTTTLKRLTLLDAMAVLMIEVLA
jgi:hypothetical protein